MKLIQRTTLHSQGNPQSIYEVNLWEVEAGKYDVSFIYIEFNNYSTTATKTNKLVSLAEAEKIFNRFIRDKKKRGYRNIFHTSDNSMSITQPFFDDVKRKQAILERLESKKPSKWKLERAIWRAGELKIKEATPLLINLIGTGEALRDYCIAWALGWCGDKSTIPALTQLYENPETPEFVSRITFEALLKLASEGTKATLQMDLIASLPLELGRLARTSSPELFEQFAVTHSYYFFSVFEKLYQIDNPYIRSSILKILRSAPFQPNYFRSIRSIFKIAEYRRDAEVFAILAYRFERVAGNFNNDLLTFSWDDEEEKKYQLDHRRVYDDELKKPQPIVAYSYQTQQYLRRRVWRTLKRLGENTDANYIKMAVAILLEYSDNDDGVVTLSRFSKWDNYTRNIKQYWDKYADYLTFNHILYSKLSNYFKYIKSQRKTNPDLRLQFVLKLINIILTIENQERTLVISKKTVLKIINAKSSSLQELSGLVLIENSDYFCQLFTTSEIVELANHDIVSIRQAAQRLFSKNLNRLRNNSTEMLEAVRILDAKWEDTREFAYHILTTEFNKQDFTSDILIAICDSTHAEGRKIGRDLLTRNFREVDGEEYFLKLSEHPAQDMQKFVTNYFEKYAADNPQRLRELTPYFITVLSSVNRNRTAKKRVLTFFEAELDKSHEAAEIIAGIVSRQSASMATADKANAIKIMLKIKKKYSNVSLPIQLQPVTEERRKSLKTAI